ncbi:MAG: DUF1732 domain-containing protein [Fusobacteriaceae bacterium]|nr:DUF1732 domain-containing protein [Fusobacteriaceae bacterium]
MRSMTGYAKLFFEDDRFSLKMEIKSINNKNLNVKIKQSYMLNYLEPQIRTELARRVTRGSIDLKIEFTDKRDIDKMFTYDRDLTAAYVHVLDEIERDFEQTFTNKMDILVKNLNVIQKNDPEFDENEYGDFILGKLGELLDSFVRNKEAEGGRLTAYFQEKAGVLAQKVAEIKKHKDSVVENYRTLLLERLGKIRGNVEFSESDILREILLYTDRSDISEEISRLESHLTQLSGDLSAERAVIGKKIEFVLQEIFRELNTTGVKCNLYEIQALVVEAKNEVEKLREQIMNIE